MQSHSFDEFVKFLFCEGLSVSKNRGIGSQLSRASSETKRNEVLLSDFQLTVQHLHLYLNKTYFSAAFKAI